jgi:acetate kinase
VLAINAGSSSLKLRLLDASPAAPAAAATALASGTIERLGTGAQWTFEHGAERRSGHEPIADHAAAVERALAWLGESVRSIEAVGHRVVHGGARFTTPVVIDDAVVAAIEAADTLAPLHNRPSLAGIRACRAALAVPMVAVFDTAFHAGLPAAAA